MHAAATMRLPRWRLAVFAALPSPLSAAGMALTVYVPAYYAQDVGLSLGVVGAIFMFGRLWDALSDVAVGALIDRYGRYKRWIAAGVALFAIAGAAVFMPKALDAPQPSMASLGLGLCALYSGWTMAAIPHAAWSGALVADYHQRSRVQSYIQVLLVLGLLAVLFPPMILEQQAGPTGQARMAVMGGVIIGAAALAAVLLLALFPEPAARPAPTRAWTLLQMTELLAREASLRRVLASNFAICVAQTVRGSLFVFFVGAYMNLPRWATLLFLVQLAFALLAGPLWSRLAYRLGKPRTIIAAELTQAAINLCLLLVTPNALPFLVALTIAQGLTQSSGNILLRSIVGDLVDQHRQASQQDRGGLFFAAFSLTGKIGVALAVGAALPLLAWLGFSPQASSTAQSLLDLKLVFAVGPAIPHLLAALAVYRFPADAQGHAEIRRQRRS